MTLEDNIFLAKRKLVDNIYKSARLEGIAVTFADTYAFVENVNTGNISIDDMLKLKGLRDAWDYVLSTVLEDLTIEYIKKVHFEVCKGQGVTPLGEFRDTGVGITGTKWRPKLPEECNYEEELATIMKNPDALDRTINLFCWIQRSQMFKDGNKRVANLVANKEMIKNGLGIIAIDEKDIGEYVTLLVEYYESSDNTKLKEWLIKNAVEQI